MSVRDAADRIRDNDSFLPDEFRIPLSIEDDAAGLVEEGISIALEGEDS